MPRYFGRPLLPLLLLIGLADPLFAQGTTATISGTVRDESGAVLPGVTVTARNLGTGAARTETTGAEGHYRLLNLPLGAYEVRAELTGFQSSVRRGIELTVGREAIVDHDMRVGNLAEELVVTGEAPLVDTTTATLGGLVTREKIEQLPLNGRDLTQLMTLESGVTMIRRGSQDATAGFGAKMSISGARPDMVGWLLDGTDIQNTFKTGPAGAAGVQLGVEAVQEFRVLSNSYTAEYGTVGGGVVNTVTKSGTNSLRGSIFEFHRNSALDSKNFFDVTDDPPDFVRNQFGASLGGPIFRNKTFFFATYEGLRQRLGVTRFGSVPTADARRGVLPGQTVSVHPAVQPILNLLPLPNGKDNGNGTGEYITVQEDPTTQNYFTGRVDHSFSGNHTAFARFTYDKGEASDRDELEIISSPMRSKRQWLTLEQSSVLTSRWLNKLRIGYNRSYDAETIVPLVDIDPLMLTPFPYPANFQVPTVSTIGLAVTLPREFDLKQLEIADDVTFSSSRHTMKMGVLYKRYQFESDQQSRGGGQWRFNSLANFLRGTVTSFDAPMPGADVLRNFRQDLFGVYVQDSIRLAEHMTLNAGLRYEIITVPVEKDGKSATVRFASDTQATVGPLFENPSLRNIAPRLGFAWDPSGTGRTSVRAGMGVFYDQVLPAYWRSAAVRQPPFFSRGVLNNPPIVDTYAQLALFGTQPPLDITSLDYDIETPTMVQFNASVQRQVGASTVFEIGYSGSRGYNLIRATEAASAIPIIEADGRKFFPAGAPSRNPVWGSDRRSVSDAKSWYNALLLSAKQRLSKGLQFQASYTWGKSIDEASSTFQSALGEGFLSIDPDDPSRNRGLSLFDIRHNLVVNALWDLPWGRDRETAAARVLGGWQLGGILTLQSGMPFTPVLGFNNSRNRSARNLFEVPNLKAGESNNPVLGGHDRYYDASVFELAPPGYFGNLGRNTIIGPGVALVDASLTKNVPMGRFKAQIRVEVFNLLNRANFGQPLADPVLLADGTPNPAAGQIRSTSTAARQVQLGMKVIW